MENFRKVLLAGLSILAFSFLAVNANAQSGQWVQKAEKNGISVAASVQLFGNTHPVLVLRASNNNAQQRTVSVKIAYQTNAGVDINRTLSFVVPAGGSVEGNHQLAMAGVNGAHFVFPQGVSNVDVNKVNVTIE